MEPESRGVDGNIDLNIWRQFSSVYKILYKNLEKFLSSYDLGIIEFRILRTISNSGTCPMVKLAELNFITQPWITGIIDKLEKKNLVERSRSATDRRIINIRLKPDGTRLYNKIKERYEENISSLFSSIDRETKEQFLKILTEIEEDIKSKSEPN